MKTFLIPSGNSGIGRQAATELAATGHRVVILGRDPRKGEETISALGAARGSAVFHAVDLSTHQGVREAAELVLADDDRIDGIIHATGVMTSEDLRTADGLHPFFAVNYLSRYHLTQLLLPALRRVEAPRVLMMTASIPPGTSASFYDFPEFQPFSFGRDRSPIQLANHHYADHLARAEPRIRAGVLNAGAAKTDILRMQPPLMRAAAKVLGPLFFDSLEKSAYNVVQAALRADWTTPIYWGKPGVYEKQTPIALDPATTEEIVSISRELTGA